MIKSRAMDKILTRKNTEGNLEDRITFLLSEWLNDNSPIGQEAYRQAAKAVLHEIVVWKQDGKDV